VPVVASRHDLIEVGVVSGGHHRGADGRIDQAVGETCGVERPLDHEPQDG